MVNLLQSFVRRSGIPLVAMGFPEGWDEELIWRRNYEPDLHDYKVIDHINQIECITQPKLLETFHPERDERGRKDLLRYLVKNKGVFLHRLEKRNTIRPFSSIRISAMLTPMWGM